MGELCAVTSHSTLLPVMAALYTRMVPLVFEEGSANRQGSKQVLSAQQPCTQADNKGQQTGVIRFTQQPMQVSCALQKWKAAGLPGFKFKNNILCDVADTRSNMCTAVRLDDAGLCCACFMDGPILH